MTVESQRLEQTLATAKKGLLAAETTAIGNGDSVKPLLKAVAEIKAEQKQLQTQLDSHLRQILADEELEDTLERSGDPKRVFIESQLAEVQQRLDERNAQLTDAATLVTEAEDSASQLAQEIGNIAARQALIEEIDKAGHGLNRQYAWLQLPVCIPGGTAWSWTYFALTILHSAHLACVLIAVSVIASVPRRWNWGGWLNLEPVGQNWHCMVSVWVILFVLFYLI